MKRIKPFISFIKEQEDNEEDKEYTFEELSPEAKINALDEMRDINVEYTEWHQPVVDDFEEEIEGDDEAEIEALKDEFWDKLYDYLEENNIEVDEELMVDFIDNKWSEKLSHSKNIDVYLKYAKIGETKIDKEPKIEESKINSYLDAIEGYEILMEINENEEQQEEYLSEIDGYLILMELEGADESLIEEIKTKFEL